MLDKKKNDSDRLINTEEFWSSIFSDAIERVTVKRASKIKSSLSFWVPWIGEHLRMSNEALNTEFKKFTFEDDLFKVKDIPNHELEWIVHSRVAKTGSSGCLLSLCHSFRIFRL